MKEWLTIASEHAIVAIDMLALVIVYAAIEAFIKAVPASSSAMSLRRTSSNAGGRPRVRQAIPNPGIAH
jgi:hypothetical protein